MSSALHVAVAQSWSLSPDMWGAGAFLAMDDADATHLVQEGGRAWSALLSIPWHASYVFDPRLFVHAELQRIFRDARETPASLGGLAMFWLAFDARHGLPLADLAPRDPYFVHGAHRLTLDADEPPSSALLLPDDATVPSPLATPYTRTLQRWANFLRASPAERLTAVWTVLARDLPWEFAALSSLASCTRRASSSDDTPLRASASTVFSHLLVPPHR